MMRMDKRMNGSTLTTVMIKVSESFRKGKLPHNKASGFIGARMGTYES